MYFLLLSFPPFDPPNVDLNKTQLDFLSKTICQKIFFYYENLDRMSDLVFNQKSGARSILVTGVGDKNVVDNFRVTKNQQISQLLLMSP